MKLGRNIKRNSEATHTKMIMAKNLQIESSAVEAKNSTSDIEIRVKDFKRIARNAPLDTSSFITSPSLSDTHHNL